MNKGTGTFNPAEQYGGFAAPARCGVGIMRRCIQVQMAETLERLGAPAGTDKLCEVAIFEVGGLAVACWLYPGAPRCREPHRSAVQMVSCLAEQIAGFGDLSAVDGGGRGAVVRRGVPWWGYTVAGACLVSVGLVWAVLLLLFGWGGWQAWGAVACSPVGAVLTVWGLVALLRRGW